MNKHKGPGAVTSQCSAAEVHGVGIVARSSHIPLGGEVINFGAEVDIKSANFDTSALRIGDLNQQVTGPGTIGIHVGVRQVDGHRSQRSIRLDGERCTGLGAVQNARVEGDTNLVGFTATRLTAVRDAVGITVGRTSGNLTTVGDTVTITVGEVFAGIEHAIAVAVGDRISFTLIRDGAVVAVFRSAIGNVFFVAHAVAIAVGAVGDQDIQTDIAHRTVVSANANVVRAGFEGDVELGGVNHAALACVIIARVSITEQNGSTRRVDGQIGVVVRITCGHADGR